MAQASSATSEKLMKAGVWLAIAAGTLSNIMAGALSGHVIEVFRVQIERDLGGEMTNALPGFLLCAGKMPLVLGGCLALMFGVILIPLAYRRQQWLPLTLSIAFIASIMQLAATVVVITMPYIGLKDDRPMQVVLAKEILWERDFVWLTDGKTNQRREVPPQKQLQEAFLAFAPSCKPVGADLMTLTFARGSGFNQQCFDVSVDSAGNGYFGRRGFPKTFFFSIEMFDLLTKSRVSP